MRIILDTNVLLVSLLKTSRYRPIFDALLNKKYKLIVSHDILSEPALAGDWRGAVMWLVL